MVSKRLHNRNPNWISVPNNVIIIACKRSLGQGNIFTNVCQEFCSQRGVPGSGGAWSRGGVETPRDGYCGQYASYWNAFLFLYAPGVPNEFTPGFQKLTILASVAFLCENKKISNKILPPVRIELGPLPFQFDAYPTELTCVIILSCSFDLTKSSKSKKSSDAWTKV